MPANVRGQNSCQPPLYVLAATADEDVDLYQAHPPLKVYGKRPANRAVCAPYAAAHSLSSIRGDHHAILLA
jgi:hypothetical protein